jgi:gas vesicle protein
MANEYDRYEGSEGNSGFMLGLLTGTVLGAGLGMLFAPKAGSELRGQLGEQAGNLGRAAQDQYRRASEAASSVAERARDTYNQVADKAREAVNRGVEEARNYQSGTSPNYASGSGYSSGSTPGSSSGTGSSGSSFGTGSSSGSGGFGNDRS